MRRKMLACSGPQQLKNDRSLRVASIRGTYAGRIHRRAFPSAKKSATLHAHSSTTEYTWREAGSPFLRGLERHLRHAAPWVMEAFLAVIKAQGYVASWGLLKLEEREAMLDAEVARAYAETVRITHTPESTLTERMDADQTLLELLAERQAVRIEIAERREREQGQRRGH